MCETEARKWSSIRTLLSRLSVSSTGRLTDLGRNWDNRTPLTLMAPPEKQSSSRFLSVSFDFPRRISCSGSIAPSDGWWSLRIPRCKEVRRIVANAGIGSVWIMSQSSQRCRSDGDVENDKKASVSKYPLKAACKASSAVSCFRSRAMSALVEVSRYPGRLSERYLTIPASSGRVSKKSATSRIASQEVHWT